MPLTWKGSQEAANRINAISIKVLDDWQAGEFDQEPQLTDRFFGALRGALSESPIEGLSWRAHTLADRGPNSAENLYGADALVVLDIQIRGFTAQKGILAQAKILDSNRPMRKDDFNDLREQCRKMLELSPDSFVWLYTRKGILVLPAISVVGLSPENRKLGSAVHWGFTYFVKSFIDCFVGDGQFKCAKRAELERVAEVASARSALLLQAREETA